MIGSVLLGTCWQRFRLHLARDVLDAGAKSNAEMLAAAIRTIFAQPDAAHVTEQFEVIAAMTALPTTEIDAPQLLAA